MFDLQLIYVIFYLKQTNCTSAIRVSVSEGLNM
jgi:hypothetical protein